MAQPVLEIDNLSVQFNLKRGVLRAIDQISFDVGKGETFGLVGESGSGKSVTARAIMRLIPSPPGEIATGTVRFQGRDLYQMPDDEIREIRGQNIAMVFQEPMNALNPVFTVGSQIGDALRTNMGMSKQEARERTIEMLQLVGIPSPSDRVDNYVHEFSGGMRQRVMLAMALSCDPTFLIADEPTTALDVTIQAVILELITSMIERFDMSLLFITHNLGVVAHACDKIGVMYASHIVEVGTKEEIFANPQHPYTVGLLRSIPRLDVQSKFLTPIDGTVCNMMDPPPGCKFNPRCAHAMDICRQRIPEIKELSSGHFAACHLHDQPTV
ncbi:MAG: ABC transporter ATP-binding protein [Alphaproteobacteria bacterium]|jgi:oligopeptide/dipeptide ABC transporter ATP-binding protein|nr:ABC transporter ATP-binding protein [Alphaproteobacteria bacterium]MDP6255720.1 ABC transporter ATP-binding protein [Alphaproteobacteria bacterium]MDP7052941.1 ABC transporter ATP-binding protein [Alphaproteobacteria bacterium]MDP7228747.1 ABC transporter ATP-binding protein [Alphaproteobacteria bacterium]MDP7461419.1 ABC transporter ATP-binding protein [Alphaproteobacteria bacterium]|tara:strand:- start:2656 stop:3636 length:981 start_codon:yes stop_codon:yes gene_type:complete